MSDREEKTDLALVLEEIDEIISSQFDEVKKEIDKIKKRIERLEERY